MTDIKHIRVEISPEEMARRVGAHPPTVYLTNQMPDGEIRWESFQAPQCPRMVAYVLNERTYRRACDMAWNYWGHQTEGIPGAVVVLLEDRKCNTVVSGSEIRVSILGPPNAALLGDTPPGAVPNLCEWRIRIVP